MQDNEFDSQSNFSMTQTSLGYSGGSVVINPPASAGDTGSILGQEDPLEEEMLAHSSILAWKVSWTEGPGGL